MKNQVSPPSFTVASTTACGIDQVSYAQCRWFGPQWLPVMSAEAPPVKIAALSLARTMSLMANAAEDSGTSVIRSTPWLSSQSPAIDFATSGFSCRSAEISSTFTSGCSLAKSSTARRDPATDPGPVLAE